MRSGAAERTAAISASCDRAWRVAPPRRLGHRRRFRAVSRGQRCRRRAGAQLGSRMARARAPAGGASDARTTSAAPRHLPSAISHPPSAQPSASHLRPPRPCAAPHHATRPHHRRLDRWHRLAWIAVPAGRCGLGGQGVEPAVLRCAPSLRARAAPGLTVSCPSALTLRCWPNWRSESKTRLAARTACAVPSVPVVARTPCRPPRARLALAPTMRQQPARATPGHHTPAVLLRSHSCRQPRAPVQACMHHAPSGQHHHKYPLQPHAFVCPSPTRPTHQAPGPQCSPPASRK